MQRDTLFRIASMTKPITAVATMILIEEGKLRLDDPVDRFLPELANRRVLARIDAPIDDTVPAQRPITTRDLLTFRFGMGFVLAPPGKYPIQKAIADAGLMPGPDPSHDDAGRLDDRSSVRCRCCINRASNGLITPAPTCSACSSHAPPTNRSQHFCRSASSRRSA